MNGNTAIKHEEPDKSLVSVINHIARKKGDEWAEVMQLAEKYGFIRFAYAGFAMLSIDEEGMKEK